MTVRRENEISRVILDAAIEVHSVLARPGLLEGVYEEAIACEQALGAWPSDGRRRRL